jgi:ligand-binding SRPBCC domain-containing protein
MSIYQITRTQKLPVSIYEIWDFISSPHNLKEITPPYMGFEVKTPNLSPNMFSGMIISYQVKPLLGIPLTWVTEITHVEEGVYFVDEQRKGPYKLWHHLHRIEVIPGGILMTDLVNYEPPFGYLGTWINSLFLRKKLNQIFEYREKVLAEKFGIMP